MHQRVQRQGVMHSVMSSFHRPLMRCRLCIYLSDGRRACARAQRNRSYVRRSMQPKAIKCSVIIVASEERTKRLDRLTGKEGVGVNARAAKNELGVTGGTQVRSTSPPPCHMCEIHKPHLHHVIKHEFTMSVKTCFPHLPTSFGYGEMRGRRYRQ